MEPSNAIALRLRDHVNRSLPDSVGRRCGSVYVPAREADTSVFRDGGIIVMAWRGDRIDRIIRVDAGARAGYQLTAADAEAALVNLESATYSNTVSQ